MSLKKPDPPMTEAECKEFMESEEREALQRYVDQPGQWVDRTPPDLKRRQHKAMEELVESLKKDSALG